jgi:predicted transposase/invertase (TIGR01784 family)
MTKLHFTDTDDLLDIRYDNVFKAVFTKETPESRKALSSLISAFVKRPLAITTITTNEPPADSVTNRQLRFDIACKAENGELVNIEMTLYPDKFEPRRLEFHASKLFSSQDIRGTDKSFGDLCPSYQISFLVNRNFYKGTTPVHHFEYYYPINNTSLGGVSRIITIEMMKLDKIIEKSVQEMAHDERWSVFLNYLTNKEMRPMINEIMDQEEGTEMAGEVIMTISKDEAERARLMSEYKYITDIQSHTVNARREGIQQGIQESLQRARSAGLSEDMIKQIFG